MSRSVTMSLRAYPKQSVRKLQTHQVALIALLAGAAIIGTTPIFVRLSELGPLATGFWRLALALPALCLWSSLTPAEARPQPQASAHRGYAWLLAAGLAMGFDIALFHSALHLTAVANATLLTNAAPIFVVLGAGLLLKERLSAATIAGLVTAVAGASLLTGASLELGWSYLLGDGLALLSALFYAGYILSMKQARQTVPAPVAMICSGVVTAAVLFILGRFSGETLMVTSLYAWLPLLGLALISHAGGQGLISYALGQLPASMSSVVLLLQPVVAALLAWYLLNEGLSLGQACGGLIVLAGIFLAQQHREQDYGN